MSTSAATPARQAGHTIHPLFIERWSPRAYTGEEIPDSVLLTLFEAARWAPSGSNEQPWRFLYVKKGSAGWSRFFDLILPGNQRWVAQASALVVLASRKVRIGRDGQPSVSPSHSFDTGAAWQNLALQAHLLGWSAHAIGGYDRAKARVALHVPADFELEAAVAIGKPGDKSILPADLQEREIPNGRIPLKDLLLEGGFPAV